MLELLVRRMRCNDMKAEARLFAMVAGWLLAFYGIQRRSRRGTIIAFLGLGLAQGAMTIEDGELRAVINRD
jgi:hypothetical protein